MKITEFRKLAKAELKQYPELRKGQAMFNVLCKLNSKWAEEIRGQKIDPFYNDENIPAFEKWLKKKSLYKKKAGKGKK